jgi:hypothetical protein
MVREHGETLYLQYVCHLGNKNSLSLLRTCFYASFLLGIFFYPEDEGDKFIRNAGIFQWNTWLYIPEEKNKFFPVTVCGGL